MSLCDICGMNEATMAVVQPRPSDPTELCSIMYVCDTEGAGITTLDEMIEAMKEKRTFAAPFALFGELEASDRIGETGFLWLTI